MVTFWPFTENEPNLENTKHRADVPPRWGLATIFELVVFKRKQEEKNGNKRHHLQNTKKNKHCH